MLYFLATEISLEYLSYFSKETIRYAELHEPKIPYVKYNSLLQRTRCTICKLGTLLFVMQVKLVFKKDDHNMPTR